MAHFPIPQETDLQRVCREAAESNGTVQYIEATPKATIGSPFAETPTPEVEPIAPNLHPSSLPPLHHGPVAKPPVIPHPSPQVLDIATSRPPGDANADPKDKGDIIGWCSYTASNGHCIVVLDFVSDPILFKASKGARGWISVRTEPAAMDDQEKARQVRNLQNYVYAKVVCGLEVLTGGTEGKRA